MTTTPVGREETAAVQCAERGHNRPVLAGLMLVTFLVAMDSSIVSTALPTITGILQGFALYTWVVSIYLLTSTVTVPIYGKLADIHGRKRVLLFGIAVFLLGSVLCAFAQNMFQLVIFRGVQGIGGGAVLPVSVTMLGDMYGLEQRAKVQGWVGSMWGVSAMIGPALGGLIVDNTSWQWIFLINAPIGVAAAWMVQHYFHERVGRTRHSVDYLGAGLLMVSASALLLALTSGGRDWAWRSPISLLVIGVAAATLALFAIVERRTAEPVLPFDLLRTRAVAVPGVAGFLVGGVLVGSVTYVPLFAQGALGSSATTAGAVIATMSLGWPIAGYLSGRVIRSYGFRATAVLGGSLIVLGTAMLIALAAGSSPYYIALSAFLVGAGLGFATTAFIVGIQEVAAWEQRGAATGSYLFLRSLGGAVIVAVLGSVVNASVGAGVRGLPTTNGETLNPLDVINSVLDPSAAGAAASGPVRAVLATALHAAFVWQAIVAVVALLVILLMPRGHGAR